MIRATVLLGALVAALGAAAALADGDPASDVLYARNVFLPFPAPQADAAAAIQAQAFALPSLGKRGRRTALKYLAFDDSGRVGVVIQVFAGRGTLATFRLPLRSGSPTQTSYVAWRVPLRPPSPQLQFCVTATDPSGNRSRRSCAPIKAV